MTRRDMTILSLLGLGVWLNGAVMFRVGGQMMFESGPLALLLSGLAIGLSVCVLLRSILSWRKVADADAVTAAVLLILPGLFGDVAYVLNFHLITGLESRTAGPFAAVLVFGTAVLLAYALWLARPSRIS